MISAGALWHDVKYAVRVLRKSPGFTAAAVMSLALGIGANSAVFSIVHAVLLRALPYSDAGRIVSIAREGKVDAVSLTEFAFWKEHGPVFEAVAVHNSGANDVSLTVGTNREWIAALNVGTSFFRTLGVAPAIGREFEENEVRSGGPRAIILTDALWRRALHADPSIVGQAVILNDVPFTVAGVLPRNFWFPIAADAFVPLRPGGGLGDHGLNFAMIGRLKPGINLRQADAALAPLAAAYHQTDPEYSNDYGGLSLTPYRDYLTGDVRTTLLLLFGAVGLLMLIACSNLASLLLARLASRQREIALRLALGSGTARLLRQFAIENLLLAGAGGAAGLLGAYWLLDGLLAVVPFRLPASGAIAIDIPVLAFTTAIALATGLIFSLGPFFSTRRLDLHDSLKAGRQAGVSGSRQRTRSVLVVSEVALSVTLLVGAALLIQSLYRTQQERLGFSPKGLMVFSTPSTPDRRGNAEKIRTFEAAFEQRVRAIPGVRSVGASSVLPLMGKGNFPAERQGHPESDIGGMEIRYVSAGYLETMGTPVLRGRGLTGRDSANSLPVILVNETVARRWWGDSNPLGDRVLIGWHKGKPMRGADDPAREVIGVVADTKTLDLKENSRPIIFVPVAQIPYEYSLDWVVRGNFSSDFALRLRRAAEDAAPRQRIGGLRTMDEVVAATTRDSRFDAWLFGAFAALALLLTAVGVYGLLAFSVARRASEIGTRIALGASEGDVLRLILRQGMVLVGAGLVIGIPGALLLTKSLRNLLFGVHPTDGASFIGVSIVLLAVGILASYLPARRAARIDPMQALRTE